jgi:CheY-like chemotaxis protein
VRWEIDIVDTGIGMSEATQKGLFERFQWGDASLTRKQSGSGLGLEISRSLVRLMGGELTARSQLGQGSVFTLSLKTPWATLAAGAAPAPGSGDSASPDPLEPGLANEALRVLVAEDHPVNRKVVGLLLQSMGHQVSFAEDGQQALMQASQFDFDLVLMDIHMPVMDGLSSTRHIRALPGERGRVPIVALTADVMSDAAEQATAAGMTPFYPNHCKKHCCRRSCRSSGGRLDALNGALVRVQQGADYNELNFWSFIWRLPRSCCNRSTHRLPLSKSRSRCWWSSSRPIKRSC